MRQIESGSVAAQALYHVWSGAPAVVVSSPPGAGKSTLVTQVIEQVATRANMLVAVATPNRAQAFALASRLQGALGEGIAVLASSRDKQRIGGKTTVQRPRGLDTGVMFAGSVNEAQQSGARVVVATTKKWWHTKPTSFLADFDLLVVDEAFQVTYGDFAVLAGIARQVLLVGDSGQVPPIVSCDTSRWESASFAPHRPAPETLCTLYPEQTTALTLSSTYRCGPVTADLLQPLYPFVFGSSRPDTFVVSDGVRMPEVQTETLRASSPHDGSMFDAAANAVRDLLGSTLVVDGERREIVPSDIAVIAAHVHQTVAVRSRLGADLADVAVETVERTQGGEWPVVVVVDPANGYAATPEHNASSTRLCVSLSRATAHTRWIMDPAVLPAVGVVDPVSASVRERLLAL